MNAITPDECRELAGMLGIPWHENVEVTPSGKSLSFKCLCGYLTSYGVDWNQHRREYPNPNFLDPVVVLREAEDKRPDFVFAVFCIDEDRYHDFATRKVIFGRLCNDILDKSGLLARRLYDWMKEKP